MAELNPVPPQKSGIYNQQQEIPSDPHPGYQISNNVSQLLDNVPETVWRKDQEDQT